MSRKIFKSLFILFGFIILGAFSGTATASARVLSDFGKFPYTEFTDEVSDILSENIIDIHDPFECLAKGNINAEGCFKVNSSTSAQAFWYPEGCLSDCTSGRYAHNAYDDANPFLRGDTQADGDFGNMQYIYAENYDIDLEAWPTKYTPNGGNSTQKYYWIVLPSEAYSNGSGETYVATFENLSEPIYFITYDTHQCGHQSEDYCGQASANPDAVEIGGEFLGAFTTDGGNYTRAAEIAGKLTSFCRIKGKGEVTVSSSPSNGAVSGTTGSSSSTEVSGEDVTWIGDSYSVAAHSIIEEKLPGISFGSGIENSNSYIQSDKGVSDRYGGGTSNPPALTILKRLADSGELKPYLVMAVGTNAGWDDNEVAQLKDILSSHSDTKVVLVNAKAKAHLMSDDNGTNDRLKALADSEDNFYLADWAAAYDASYFANNTTHPDANGGYEKWVEVIYNVLSNIGGCVSYNTSESDYPQYYQQTGYTCGPTSMAMLATVAAGQDVSEADVIEAVGSDRAYANTGGSGMVNLDKIVGEKYGFEVIGVDTNGSYSDTATAMRQYLNDGYMIHLSGAGSKPFSDVGHYIGIFNINGDTVLTADSSNGNQEYNLEDLISRGYHGDQFAAIRRGNQNPCNAYCKNESTSHSGGFQSVEEADSVVMDPYRDMAANHPEDWGKYHITAGTPYNCFSFSNYFISRYTTISDFYGVPGVDGGGYAEEFYNLYHGSYPDITLSDKPTPYSVAGCGDKYYDGSNYSHTFIVLGVDAANDTMIYGEAGYGYGSGGVLANQISLSDTSWGSRNGSTGICQYADFSKYVTGL